MSGAVSCEPISWLRLERYHLGELSRVEHETIASHLATCDRCRSCSNRIESPEETDLLALPPLPLAVESAAAAPSHAVTAAARARRRGGARWGWLARGSALGLGTVGAVAALILMVGRSTESPIPRGHWTRPKGGDVVLELVRERNGSVAYDPGSFASSDRLEIFLTCPPPAHLYADVAIVQEDGVAFPVDPIAFSCGNRIAIPSAFRITGPGAAAVCVAVDPTGPPSRERLRSAAAADTPLDTQVACIRLGHSDD